MQMTLKTLKQRPTNNAFATAKTKDKPNYVYSHIKHVSFCGLETKRHLQINVSVCTLCMDYDLIRLQYFVILQLTKRWLF